MQHQRLDRVKRWRLMGLLAIVCCLSLSCSLLTIEPAASSPKNDRSLLSSMDFPKIPVEYPAAWHENYRLPASFHLIEVQVYEREYPAVIYSARFICDEAVDATIKNIYVYVDALGWTIQRTNGRTGAVYLSARDLDGDGSCMLVASPDPDSGTRVMFTMNP